MEIQEIITQLQGKFGNSFDITKVTSALQGMDLKNFSITDIVSKLKLDGLVGDLDGDGVQESIIEEIKGKAGSMLGGIFGK